jgi:hypothetical protein
VTFDAALSKFLDTQPSIRDLVVSGTVEQHHALFIGDDARDEYDKAKDDEGPFVLQPTSLPRLVSFQAIHGGSVIAASVVPGRPVSHVGLPVFESTIADTLFAVSGTTARLRRLNLLNYHSKGLGYILPLIAAQFPDLTALHLVFVFTEVAVVRFLLPPFSALFPNLIV